MFEAFHNALFDHQDSIGLKGWGWFAGRAGITDTVAIARCIKQRLPEVRVLADIAAGDRLGVLATPTILLDSLRIIGVPSFTLLESFLTVR